MGVSESAEAMKWQGHFVLLLSCRPLTSLVLAPSIHSASNITPLAGTSAQERLSIPSILSKQLEPLITVGIMPTFRTLEACMITEGKRMIEFDVQEEISAEGQKLVTCWVPSEAGKVRSHDTNPLSGVHPHGQRFSKP
jgi:hypothetical protein